MTPETLPDGRLAKWILLLTLLIVLAARLAAGAEPQPDRTTAELYRLAKRASVEVLLEGHLAGSGFFVAPEGLLLTASHVIRRPGHTLEILSPAVGRLEAELVAVDLGHDLVLLRVASREDACPALPLAQRFPPPGEQVFLLAAPMFRHAVLLPGMVARDDTVFGYYTDKYVETSHVAATVPGGMSGGPWLNRQGQVVGMQSAVMSLNSIPVGVANVIPVEPMRTLLKRRRNAATPTLGAPVEELWQHQGDVLARFPPETEGLLVRQLNKDGPAGRAGLKQWDLITAADGQAVRLTAELLRIVRAKRPGQSLKLSVLGPDGTGRRELEVRLGRLEVGWPQAPGDD